MDVDLYYATIRPHLMISLIQIFVLSILEWLLKIVLLYFVHTFVEIDHEMISTVILLPSADSFKKGCCQLQAKVLFKPAQEKVWLGELTVPQ